MRVDATSRGEMTTFLVRWADGGQVKKCRRLRLQRSEIYFWPVCEIDYASKEAATNVVPQGLKVEWPICPEDCPYFELSDNFQKSVSRDQYSKSVHEQQTKPPAPSVATQVLAKQVNQPEPANQPRTLAATLGDISLAAFVKTATLYTLGIFIAGVVIGTLWGSSALKLIERVLLAVGWLKQPFTTP